MRLNTSRQLCIEYYKLGPAIHRTSLGLAWDAMLFQTKIDLELVRHVDMLSMIVTQKRLMRAWFQEARKCKQHIHSIKQARGRIELLRVLGR